MTTSGTISTICKQCPVFTLRIDFQFVAYRTVFVRVRFVTGMTRSEYLVTLFKHEQVTTVNLQLV
jgi:hypothetical protein